MKLSPIMQIKVAAVSAVALVLLGCEAPVTKASEQTPPVYPTVAAPPQPDLVTIVTNNVPQPIPDGITNAPSAVPVQLSPQLQEVVKLAESSVGDEVILAFIQNSPTPFNPTPEEIVYLTDLGLSDVVITALVNHRGTQAQTAQQPAPPPVGPVGVEAQPAPAPAQPEATYNPEPQVAYSAPPQVQYVVPEPAVEYDYFYSSLSPYGSWVDVVDYGWCWQPTVAVIHRDWRPYCDRGRWLYTDAGWYWHSDYSWGWAPFHYGRWFHHPARGWCWRPGSDWGPAWVSWRYSDSYCGWAPLPPGARFHPGHGFTYYGARVGASFGFGLHYDAWTFVPAHRFHDREVWRYRARPSEHLTAFRRSKVYNNYSAVDNHVVNHGVGRDRLPALGRVEPRKVAIRELPDRRGNGVRPDRLHQDGSEVVIYRPKPLEHSLSALDDRPQRPTQAIRSGGVSPAPLRGSSLGSSRSPAPAQGAPVQTVPSRSEPRPPIGATRPSTAQGTSGRTFRGSTAPAVGRTELAPSRSTADQNPSSQAPTVTPPAAPAVGQDRPNVTIITPRSAEPRPNYTAQPQSRMPSSAGRPSFESSGSAGPLFQRPTTAAPQAVAPPSVTTRQEPVQRSAEVAERSEYRPQPRVYQAPAEGFRNSPVQGPSFSLPQQSRPAPSYSAPAVQSRPAPSFSAPALRPSYSPPAVQSRPSYTPPAVQSRPSYTPPAVQSRPAPSFSIPATRSAPQAAPAPSQRSGGRRQN